MVKVKIADPVFPVPAVVQREGTACAAIKIALIRNAGAFTSSWPFAAMLKVISAAFVVIANTEANPANAMQAGAVKSDRAHACLANESTLLR
jgi:hypothetical protein